MVKTIGKNEPIRSSDLLRAEELPSAKRRAPRDAALQVGINPSSGASSCVKPLINGTAIAELRRICEQTGELYDLDIEVAARQLGQRAKKSLLSAYDAVKALKAKGKLEDADRATELSAPLAAKLSEPRLPQRVREHIHALAAKDLLENVTHPTKDETLRQLLAEHFGGATDAPPPDMTLRERNSRQTIALRAVLDDKKLSEPLTLMILGQLGKNGDRTAIPTLEKLAASGKTESIRATAGAAINAIQKSQKMTIVLASFEVKPYAGTGGLGNVMQELPKALASMGHRVIVLSPRHTTIDRDRLEDTGLRGSIEGGAHGDEPFQILKDVKDGVENYFIENDRYFSAGRFGIYGDKNGEFGDNWKRFDFFSAAIPLTIKRILGDDAPDIIQLNDAHTGPAAAYIRGWGSYFESTKTIMAVHNLAYQQVYPKETLDDFCFSKMNLFWPTGPAEFYDRINLLKLGLTMSDAVISVSRQYTKEILTDQFGEGLQAVLRSIDARGCLWGNLNGIDNSEWNPATDPALPASFSFADQSGKAACKAKLQSDFGLEPRPDTPVIGVVARLADQKGWGDVISNIEHTLEQGKDVQYVLMGQGDKHLAEQLQRLKERFPAQVAFDPDFTAKKEHLIYGGSDFFLMPSKFEPCGLPQMYALRYLTVPIVRSVGGLEESIRSWSSESGKGNGFKFIDDIDAAVNQALAWYGQPAERQALLRNCALSDFSWETSSAVEQAAFYREMLNG